MNHSLPAPKYSTQRRRAAKRARRLVLTLLVACVGSIFALHALSVEGKKEVAQENGDVVQSAPAEVLGQAVVNFQQMARQQALNPTVSDPAPMAISPPKTIEEVGSNEESKEESESGKQAEAFDVPSPMIPSPAPANNFAGLDDIAMVPPGTAFFTIPPDTTGAVGRDADNKVFVTLNNNFRVQNKTTGATISTVSMPNFWTSTGSTNPFDPRVLYDPYNDRWIVAAVSNAGSAATSILVGVSQTSDPGGAYFLFRVAARVGTDIANVNFADFPMLGFNKNWIVVSINMFNGVSGAFSDGRSLVIDYAALRTNTFTATYFFGVAAGNAGFCMHPATTYSATEATEYLVAHQSSGGATYRMHTITGTPAAPIFTVGVLKVRPGGGWTQPGGNILPQAQGTCATPPTRIESRDAFVRSNVVFRNNSIWYPQAIGLPAGVLTHTAAQWTQLDTAGNFVQGGRVDDPTATATNGGKWYSDPSISVNASNDVVFGFSEFESDEFPDSGYTYRDHTDAAGTMRDPVIYKTGEDCYVKDFGSGRNRWGDYSHTMVDPTDDCTFWTIQEYAKLQAPPVVGGSSSKWGTWWAKINGISPCSNLAAGAGTLVIESCPPANGSIDAGERVSVHLQVTNNGAGPTVNLVGTLQTGGGVLYPSGGQRYGDVPPGATVGRDFSFTADPSLTPGSTITATLQLQDGAINLGTVAYTFIVGSQSGCGIVRLVVTSTLARTGPTNVRATYTVTNQGSLPANGASLTIAKLGATNGTPLPQALGNIAPGGSSGGTVDFTNSTPGASSTLILGGTYTNGSFNSTKRVIVP